jgi:prepilin-type N-terminal cleavage/methylation domain-containing protein
MSRLHRLSRQAFTLVEMLVATAVLSILLMLLMQLINSTTATTAANRLKMSAEDEARFVFDRLAADIMAIPNQRDVDFLFSKNDGNDTLFFFSQVAGHLLKNTAQPSPYTLVGYRVSSPKTATGSAPAALPFQLERMAIAAAWQASSADPAGSVMHLMPSASSYAPLPETTLTGNRIWSPFLGEPPLYDDGNSSNYTPVGRSVFRFELIYHLKNGAWSNKPVAENPDVSNNLGASDAPTKTADTEGGYQAGSRWYDHTTQRGYICTRADSGQATWEYLGLRDVGGILVTIALLDPSLRETSSADLSRLAQQFPDADDQSLQKTPAELPAQTWESILNKTDFAASAGIRQSGAGPIRIYQRYFKCFNR